MKEILNSTESFLERYYSGNDVNNVIITYRFISQLASEAKVIGKHEDLNDLDLQNAIIATWFRYAGSDDIDSGQTEKMKSLLNEYFEELDFPSDQRLLIGNAIITVAANMYTANKTEQVVYDAVHSRLADQNFIENIAWVQEASSTTLKDRDELFYLKYFLTLFTKIRYYTTFATEKYSSHRLKNFQYVEKRIAKLKEGGFESENLKSAKNSQLLLSDKETDDLFKIAFRNYNQLVAVADSKASLLINVNSIIISVMIAFVFARIDKLSFILWPTIILLCVCLGTIILAILASRPQNNSFMDEKKSQSYQRFFFGSFDMVDPAILYIRWEEYYAQMIDLFHKSKESIYLELYKESYNVRKVLSRKFNYLSLAYWVFLLGLLVSVFSFVLAIYYRK